MSSMIGNKLKVSIFGESHGGAIGVVIDGLPSGLEIDLNFIQNQMERRAPGKDNFSTARKESDKPSIVSGLFEGKTTGSPLCAIIFNEDTRSKDYSLLKSAMRPGHADYTGYVKYSGFNDYRGGGHFSGRLTAPLLFAGALAMQILERYMNIHIGTRIKKIYKIDDNSDFENHEDIIKIKNMDFPVINQISKKLMQQEILKAKEEGDSVGGVAETIILNIPPGYGEPFFDSVESKISHMIFSIPAVKGIEFGQGFNITNMKGSQSNDPYYAENGNILLKSNNNGGILGGITNGMPVVFRTAIKPTPSIAKEQETINISTMENTTLKVSGRHDPCIMQRAIPVIDAAAALVVLDLIMEREGELLINKNKSHITNIVLIGMPGSGKTTIGSLISRKLKMKHIDMDDYIEKREQKKIKELFAVSEECFRDAETKCSEELSKLDNCVISAGGGIIKRNENISMLKRSSIIVFINRTVKDIASDIDISTRPLLKDGVKRLYDLYDERIHLYKSYCDVEVDNSGKISETVDEVIKKVEEYKKRQGV